MGIWPTTVHEKSLDSRLRGNDLLEVVAARRDVIPAKAGIHCGVLIALFSVAVPAIFMAAKNPRSCSINQLQRSFLASGSSG